MRHRNTLHFLALGLCGLFTFCCSSELRSQVRVQVRVNSGSSTTTCTDGFFGGSPDPQWRVDIDNQGYTTYPRSGICFTNFPNTQFDESYDCGAPATLQVCFRAFEDDGAACVVSESCSETICQNFAVPAPGNTATYTLALPAGRSSGGSVNFSIIVSGSVRPGAAWDVACNAANLGTLNAGGTVGNAGQSNFANYCAGTAGDPAPSNWSNDQGVWTRFTTGANPGGILFVEGNSDPSGAGDNLNMQIAIYRSVTNTCAGPLVEVASEYDFLSTDEDMELNCPTPNTTYWMLVDGADLPLLGGQQGYFGIAVSDDGIAQAGDQICDAQHLGTVPGGGSIGTPSLSQTNRCANDVNDPNPGAFDSEASVWYSFIPPPSGSVTISCESDLIWPFGDGVDIQLAVYNTNPNTCSGTLSEVISEWTPGLFGEDMDVRCLDPTRRYYVMVNGSLIDRRGIFDISISDDGRFPAPNDRICDAIPLGLPLPNAPVSLNNLSNYCADNLFEPIPQNWGNEMGVWFTFIAPPSGLVTIRGNSLGSDDLDLQFAVYDSPDQLCTGAPLRHIDSEWDGFGLLWDEDMTVECLEPGRTYYLLVDGNPSILNPQLIDGQFNIRIEADGRSAASPNDDICNATPLGNPDNGPIATGPPINGNPSQNNFCADVAPGEPRPTNFTSNQTVWYSFTAPSTGSVNLSAQSDGIFGDPIDLQVAVFGSSNNTCTGTFTELVSGDPLITGLDIDLDVHCMTPGNTYYIMFDGGDLLAATSQGYFDLQIREIAPHPIPTNDLICQAISLGNPWTNGPSSLTNQFNLCATDFNDPQPSEFTFGTNQTVWYSFTTPVGGIAYALDVDATTSLPWPFGTGALDLQLAVFDAPTGCSGTLTEVRSEWQPGFFDESMTVGCLRPNTTYYLMVDGSAIDREGYFDIDISASAAQPIPTNDLICNATNLGAVPVFGAIATNTNYFNFCADSESGEPSPFTLDQTVWFTFQAPLHTGLPNVSSNVSIVALSDPNNVGDRIDLQIALYDAPSCNGPFRRIDDSDPFLLQDAGLPLVTCLVPGRTYWLQVDGAFFDREGYFTLNIADAGSGDFPLNDNRCNATPLGTVPNNGVLAPIAMFDNRCATVEPNEPDPSAFGLDNTVWYTFVPPASGNVAIGILSINDIDAQVSVWRNPSGNCSGTFVEVNSNYIGINTDELVTATCLHPGETYYIQVDGTNSIWGDAEGDFGIVITDIGGSTSFPYNNDICNARDFGVVGNTQTLNNENSDCADVEVGEPGLGGYAEHTIWYRFTAPTSGRVIIDVDGSRNGIPPFIDIDPEVRLFSSSSNSCAGPFQEMEQSYFPGNGGLLSEQIETSCLVPGNVYFIQIDGTGISQTGDIDISIRDPYVNYGTGLPGDPEPANNECVDAQVVPVSPVACAGGGTFLQLNYGQATASAPRPTCGQDCGDTWYAFTVPQTGLVNIVGNDDAIGGLTGDFSELVVQAYTGTCAALSPIQCDQGGFTSDVGMEIAATPGSTIYLQVFNNGGQDNGEDYELCVSTACGADNCLTSLAVPMIPNVPYCFNTGAANGENLGNGAPGYSECSSGQANDSPEQSVYYSFRSDCNGSSMTLSIMNVDIGGTCLGTIPTDQMSISLFQDATPCDNNPDALVDCQTFSACDNQPINWSLTYNNLSPNTDYVLQLESGLGNVIGGSAVGQIMIQTTTSPSAIATPLSAVCGSSLGSATANGVSGTGVPPYTFRWDNNETTQTATALTAGLHRVTVTDASGCTASASVQVSVSLPMSITGSVTSAGCPGACAGRANITVTGGRSPFTFAWNNGRTTQNISGLCPGTYTVTVTDTANCTATAVANISGLQSATIVSSQEQCNIAGTQYIWSVTVSGGNGLTVTGTPGTFNNPIFTSNAILSGQTARITVSDSGGCPAITLTSVGNCQPPLPCVLTGCVGSNVALDPGFESFSSANPTNNYTTSYPYNGPCITGANNCGNFLCQGQYAIANSVPPCNPTWANITDHTTGTGNFMLVDYNGSSSQAIWCSTVTLQPATQYCFGAWLANLLPAGSNRPRPQVRFEVDGQALGSTPDIPEDGQWHFHSYSFNSGAGGVSNVCFYNHNFGGLGYDLAIDDITVRSATGGTPPSANTESFSICPGFATAVTATVLSNDTNGSNPFLATSLSVTQAPSAGQGTAVVNGQNIIFTPSASFTGTSLTYQICDGFGCCDTAAVRFIRDNFSVSITPQSSCNFASVTTTVVASNGTPASYQWSTGASTNSAVVSTRGNVDVTVTNTLGCRAFDSEFMDIQAPATMSLPGFPTSGECTFNDYSVTATMLVTGTNTPYTATYQWSDYNGNLLPAGQVLTVNNITRANIGIYTVTATNAQGCTATAETFIVRTPNITVTHTDFSCAPNFLGSANVTTTPSVLSPLSIEWSTGATTNAISGLLPGVYCVTVTADLGCTASECVTVTDSYPDVSATFATNPPSCHNFRNGSINVTTTGGLGTLTVRWSDGSTGNARTGLAAGVYNMTVGDSFGCNTPFAVTLTNPPVLSTRNAIIYHVRCFGQSDAAIDIDVTGGTPNYSYVWSNGQSTQDLTGLSVGNFTVTVTDNAGCSEVTLHIVEEPTALSVSLAANPILCSGNLTNITPTVGGGTGGYTYRWDNLSVTPLRSNVRSGIYSLSVLDALNCVNNQTITITEPTALTTTFNVGIINCFGQSTNATLTAAGGTPTYTFTWNGSSNNTGSFTGITAGVHNFSISDANGCSATRNVTLTEPTAFSARIDIDNQITCHDGNNGVLLGKGVGGTLPYGFVWGNGSTNAQQTGLTSGNYFITVTDARGCSDTASFFLLNPPPVTFGPISITNSDCALLCNGVIEVSATSHNPGNFIFAWSNGMTGSFITGLCAGTYIAMATDAAGCTAVTNAITITEPNPMTVTMSATPASCSRGNDGTTTVLVNGGFGLYRYVWRGSTSNSSTITGLSAGVYAVTILDGIKCFAFDSVAVSEPSAIASTITNGIVPCFGGTTSMTVTASGGTGQHFYRWNGISNATGIFNNVSSGIQRVSITDQNGCLSVNQTTITEPNPITVTAGILQPIACYGGQGAVSATASGGTGAIAFLWNNGQASSIATGLTAGSYAVTATDINGCSASQTINIGEPTAISISLGLGSIACNGGNTTATATVSGGTPNYIITWDGLTSGPVGRFLEDGSHVVLVTDANRCTASQVFNLTEPTPLNTNASVANPTCANISNGIGFSNAIGGTPPYSERWSNGELGPFATNLPSGPWSLTITDANGCATVTGGTLTAPPAITAQLNSTGVRCFTDRDGTATVIPSGGTPPYSAVWDNGVPGFYTPLLNGGAHRVTVTDAEGCEAIFTTVVTSPTPITVTLSSRNVTCFGDSDGFVIANPSGGVPGYRYIWSTGSLSAQSTTLRPGSYSVTVLDQNGCTATAAPISVLEPTRVSVSASVVSLNRCFGGNDASALATATGGTAPNGNYTYTWSNGDNTALADQLFAGTYTVVARDENGCSANNSIAITEPTRLEMNILPTPIICEGDLGSLEVMANTLTGTAPYSYSLDGGITFSNNRITDGLFAGNYVLVVQDANGCQVSTTYTLEPAPVLSVELPNDVLVNLGDSTVIPSQIIVPNGHAHNVLWTPSTFLNCMSCENPIVFPLVSTRYTILLTDLTTGCIDTAQTLVVVRKPRNVFIPTAFTPDGDGHNDTFYPQGGAGVERIRQMLLFDRWGELLYEAKNIPLSSPRLGWDGTMSGEEMNTGVFIYYIEIEFIDGTVEIYKGDVTLIR